MEVTRETKKTGKMGLTSFELKVIALISMTVDHVGVVLYPDLLWLRYIGRIAFPIYCFLLTEGFVYTRDRNQYMLRMLVLGVLSEIPFDLAGKGDILELGSQNVFFTLLIGLLMMKFLEQAGNGAERVGIILFAMFAAEFLRTDYGAYGILLIALYHRFRGSKIWQSVSVAAWNFLSGTLVQYPGVFAVFPLLLYNGKRGRKMGYFFYLYYPVHLLILYGILHLTGMHH